MRILLYKLKIKQTGILIFEKRFKNNVFMTKHQWKNRKKIFSSNFFKTKIFITQNSILIPMQKTRFLILPIYFEFIKVVYKK